MTAVAWQTRLVGWAARLPGVRPGDRDVLADARRMFYAGAVALSWRELAVRLADMHPEVYAGATAATMAALLRAEGVRATTVSDHGARAAGCTRIAIDQALNRR